MAKHTRVDTDGIICRPDWAVHLWTHLNMSLQHEFNSGSIKVPQKSCLKIILSNFRIPHPHRLFILSIPPNMSWSFVTPDMVNRTAAPDPLPHSRDVIMTTPSLISRMLPPRFLDDGGRPFPENDYFSHTSIPPTQTYVPQIREQVGEVDPRLDR
jgi:hypothetical protein